MTDYNETKVVPVDRPGPPSVSSGLDMDGLESELRGDDSWVPPPSATELQEDGIRGDNDTKD